MMVLWLHWLLLPGEWYFICGQVTHVFGKRSLSLPFGEKGYRSQNLAVVVLVSMSYTRQRWRHFTPWQAPLTLIVIEFVLYLNIFFINLHSMYLIKYFVLSYTVLFFLSFFCNRFLCNLGSMTYRYVITYSNRCQISLYCVCSLYVAFSKTKTVLLERGSQSNWKVECYNESQQCPWGTVVLMFKNDIQFTAF